MGIVSLFSDAGAGVNFARELAISSRSLDEAMFDVRGYHSDS